jgi:putative transposase
MKKRFTEAQIAFALRQAVNGTPVAEIIRKMGISEQTFYRWKKQYAGMGIPEIHQFRQLEEEDRWLLLFSPVSGPRSLPTSEVSYLAFGLRLGETLLSS